MGLIGKVGRKHGIIREDRSIQVGTLTMYIRGKRKTHGEKVGQKRGIIREGQTKETITKQSNTRAGIHTEIGTGGNTRRIGTRGERKFARLEAQGVRGTMDPGIKDQSRE